MVLPIIHDDFRMSAVSLKLFSCTQLAFVLASVFCVVTSLAGPCERLISAAPSVTELVYRVGLGDRLVGVTRFCRFPPQATLKQSIGGFLDPNLEQIAALRPTKVLLLAEQDFLRKQLETLGVATVRMDHRGIEGIRESYTIMGRVCEISEIADRELAAFDAAIERVQKVVNGAPAVKTLFVVGKTMRGRTMTSAYVSGTDGYYFSILPLVGALPAYDGNTISLPTLGSEGMKSISPEAIVDIIDRDDSIAHLSDAEMMEAWSQFRGVSAVDNKKVLIVRDDYASVPGPRAPLLIEKIARFLHPTRFSHDILEPR